MTTISPVAPPETLSGARAAPRIAADFDTFVRLLTTQLRNQDPTNAMDAQQMTAQLVQFAGVEQQLAVNRNLERLIALQQGSQLVSAAPLTGRMVEVESELLSLQDGMARLRLPAAATTTMARIEVLDGSGRVLHAAEAPLGPRPGTWAWDGRDLTGRRLADGAYAVRVTMPGPGAGAEGTPLPFTVLARATGAERSDGEVRLKLGTVTVPFEQLRGLAE